ETQFGFITFDGAAGVYRTAGGKPEGLVKMRLAPWPRRCSAAPAGLVCAWPNGAAGRGKRRVRPPGRQIRRRGMGRRRMWRSGRGGQGEGERCSAAGSGAVGGDLTAV